MRIDEFAIRFGVQSDVHHLLDYTQLLGPDNLGKFRQLPRSRWVVTYLCPDAVPGAQRVLTIDHDTSRSVDEEDIDAFEVLATAIVDARDGALTFAEYVEELGEIKPDDYGMYTAPVSRTPSKLHVQWRRLGVLHEEIREWCSLVEMRAALAEIELS